MMIAAVTPVVSAARPTLEHVGVRGQIRGLAADKRLDADPDAHEPKDAGDGYGKVIKHINAPSRQIP